MLSYIGFEAYDAPNMYQYSYAYDYAATIAEDGAQISMMLMQMDFLSIMQPIHFA